MKYQNKAIYFGTNNILSTVATENFLTSLGLAISAWDSPSKDRLSDLSVSGDFLQWDPVSYYNLRCNSASFWPASPI
ncbi:hypothetical protein Mapa_000329 [Marchantia paleacea]|nr:hypothetical protein Mapa_000329 [Marchantia paleacea]